MRIKASSKGNFDSSAKPSAAELEESGTLNLESNVRYTEDQLKQLNAQREELIRNNPGKPRPPEIPAIGEVPQI